MNNIFKLIWKFVKQKIIDEVPLRSNNIARYSELTKMIIGKVKPVSRTLGSSLFTHEPDF